MSVNNANNNTQSAQVDEKKSLDDARKCLDTVRLKAAIDGRHNKMRKKLKRWFDRCKKKEWSNNNTKPKEFCYYRIEDTGEILMGRKSADSTYRIAYPYLSIKGNDVIIHELDNANNQSQAKSTNVNNMPYDHFYKLYRQAVGLSKLQEWFLNAWDGFLSITQIPRQYMSTAPKAESVGGHVANIATRVFSPVIATGYGLYAGAKALKDKMIPTEEELKKMGDYGIQDLSDKYAKTDNKNLKDLQTSLIAKWKSGALPGMSYNNLKEVLKENQKIYENQSNKNLNTVNANSNIIQK